MRKPRLWSVFIPIILYVFNYECAVTKSLEKDFGSVDLSYEKLRGGFVGCLYQDVCLSQEVCINDFLFGRCVAPNTLFTNAEKHGFSMPTEGKYKPPIYILKSGIEWTDLYTQCLFRSMLHYPRKVLGKYGLKELCGSPPASNPSPENQYEHLGDTESEKPFSPIYLSDSDMHDLQKIYSSSLRRPFHRKNAQYEPTTPDPISNDYNNDEDVLNYFIKKKLEMQEASSGDDVKDPQTTVAGKKGLFTKRRYGLQLPDEIQTDRTLTRSWVWIQLNNPLKDGEAGKYLNELSVRLHLAWPIRRFYKDRTGYILYFQVPKSTGANAESVVSAIQHGVGNFENHAVVNVGFGRGAPVYKTTSPKRTTSEFPLVLAVCLLVIGLLITMCLVYAIYKIRKMKLEKEFEKEHQAVLIDVERLAKLRKANASSAKKPGIFQRLENYFKEKCLNTKAVEEKQQNRAESAKVPLAEQTTECPVRSSRDTSLSSNPLSPDINTKQSSVRQHNESLGSQRSSTSSWSSEPVSCGIDLTTGHLILSYMEGYLRDEHRLTTDWDAVNAYTAEEATPCADAQKPENLVKNRVSAPLPYEQSRVRLRESENDYINASLLYDHNPRNPVYIATPTPLLETIADFWQMVWEQSSVVIVCLERTNELKQPDLVGNFEMADDSVRYWPSEGVETYGNFEVHLVSEHSSCENYIVRSFYLKNQTSGETRTVTQFHYLTWMDSNLETQVKPLLEFRRKVNRSFRGLMSPIVVHCVDGAGRTGAYILLDLVLNRIAKGVKEINIAASLEHLRDQRQAMVQKKEQYEFVFTAVAKEVDAMLKATGQTG